MAAPVLLPLLRRVTYFPRLRSSMLATMALIGKGNFRISDIESRAREPRVRARDRMNVVSTSNLVMISLITHLRMSFGFACSGFLRWPVQLHRKYVFDCPLMDRRFVLFHYLSTFSPYITMAHDPSHCQILGNMTDIQGGNTAPVHTL
jgi:hypothetical protein